MISFLHIFATCTNTKDIKKSKVVGLPLSHFSRFFAQMHGFELSKRAMRQRWAWCGRGRSLVAWSFAVWCFVPPNLRRGSEISPMGLWRSAQMFTVCQILQLLAAVCTLGKSKHKCITHKTHKEVVTVVTVMTSAVSHSFVSLATGKGPSFWRADSEVSEGLCHYGPEVTQWLYDSAFQKLDLNKLKRKKRKKAKRIMEPCHIGTTLVPQACQTKVVRWWNAFRIIKTHR